MMLPLATPFQKNGGKFNAGKEVAQRSNGRSIQYVETSTVILPSVNGKTSCSHYRPSSRAWRSLGNIY